jgi:proline iminopeptidase
MSQTKAASIATLCGALLTLAVPSSAQDGSFVNRGATLHYRSAGTGPSVVLLSGGPGFDVDYMQPVADAFPSHRRILFEQRGTGRSRRSTPTKEEMTLAVAVEDLEALRKHLQVPRLFLVGHSWGGMLAMAYAAAHPANVDRLILVGSGGPSLDFETWFADNIRARMRPEDMEAEGYWNDQLKRGVSENKVAIETARAATPAYFYDRGKGLAFAAEMKEGSLHADSSALLFADVQKTYDVRAALRGFDRPTLILHGHQDPMGKTAEDIRAVIPQSIVVYFDKCGHFPWIEQPDAFRAAIAKFAAK